jgi:Protein of unknown function (DUF3626)
MIASGDPFGSKTVNCSAALSPSQRAALDSVSAYAKSRKEKASADIEHILRMSNIGRLAFDTAIKKVKARARVALHFHPDRPDPEMKSVSEALLDSGMYRNQFSTKLSSGSVSAFLGGERDRWEHKIFGGAYHAEGVASDDRPKYGALDLMRHPDGPCPRFGSCYFLLKPAISTRCTFTWLDSARDPVERGTYQEFDDIVCALLTEVFLRDFALGEPDLRPPKLIARLAVDLDGPFADPEPKSPMRNLDHYIEAQVHGTVSLADDVDILVADPSFRKLTVGRVLEDLCMRYGIALYWHCGFVLPPAEVPDDFRGPTMPSLARRIARDGYVDAGCLGQAAFDLRREPSKWSDRGTYSQVLQELKLLWHVLVKYGRPLREFAGLT